MIKIAVIGLANVGKTTFLNTLTGSNFKTANFSGSTTSKREIAMLYKGKTIMFCDFPGFNSFNTIENDLAKHTIEELKRSNFDAILHIVNAEFPYFSTILQTELEEEFSSKIITAVNFPSFSLNPSKASSGFKHSILFSALSKENCEGVMDGILNELDGKKFESINLLTFKNQINSKKITDLIDKIALSKIFGLPLFFFIMFAIFWLSFFFGKDIGDFLVSGFDSLGEISSNSTLPNFAKAIINSVLIGVGVVVGFVPTIIICISLIGILEQTGYITRVCFLLDKIFEKFGLGGKAVIPLIIGAGCSITAYMSARMINDPKEKFLTMVIVGFIPCTAKLAVFILFCGALFENYAPLALFVVYLAGFIVGLLCAKLIGIFIKGEVQKTKIEIFNYRMPIFKNVFKTGLERTLGYIKNASTFIALFSAIISFLGIVGFENGSFIFLKEEDFERSFIANFGKFLMPLFSPMGFDFKLIISLITGLIAKETALATLAVLYSTSIESLTSVVQQEIGLRNAITYLVFMFFYLPCVSATASFHRELKSYKKTFFLIGFTMILAYSFSLFANLIMVYLGF